MSNVAAVVSKDGSGKIGVEIGSKVVVPLSFCEVEIRSSEDFDPVGVKVEVLDTLPQDLRLFLAGTMPNPQSFRHYGSHLNHVLQGIEIGAF